MKHAKCNSTESRCIYETLDPEFVGDMNCRGLVLGCEYLRTGIFNSGSLIDWSSSPKSVTLSESMAILHISESSDGK